MLPELRPHVEPHRPGGRPLGRGRGMLWREHYKRLRSQEVVAIKGLGGYDLAVIASSGESGSLPACPQAPGG